MPSGARMPHQGAPMGPPGPPYGGSPAVRPGLTNQAMEASRKRPASSQQIQQQQQQAVQNRNRKKPVGFPGPNEMPGRQMDMREAQSDPTLGSNNVLCANGCQHHLGWRRAHTHSHTVFPASWTSPRILADVPGAPLAKRRKMADKILPQRIRELVPESQAYMDLLAFERKLDQTIMRKRVDIQEALKRPMKQKRKLRLYISNTFNPAKPDAEDSEGSIASWELRVEGKLLDDPGKMKRKFSSFFKSLWHRTPTTQETDGFQVKRPGDVNVRCTLLLMLDYQPPQFKLDPRLARLLGIHTQTRSSIIQALWQYVKTNKLQDSHDKEYINCDNVDPNDQKKTACYDIDVEVEDPLKAQMSSFLLSTANQQEIASLDNKIHETIESINQLKIQRDFMLSFSRDPKGYIQDWLKSQSRDLKLMTDVVGNPEEERRAEFYHQPWSQEAVSRYFYCKIQQRRQELEQALAMRNT
ncbi:SWI/SNF-related matrix-associated actin-dependent regulator of chromatin subfamily D member 3 [Labeo rohita]|uniref:SWI/SNF-related matrix-associated actin-dependent regulator of chromatin subfamily D member 3 n=1 Tax=Labeo rohita TaxID=84645 RepID=A0ABQ8MIB8_LABRO|nr:SWI/SNF-related matrix-associated actin-dependent regulator of chromatin subfamily D member 3 [Labeo rohita]